MKEFTHLHVHTEYSLLDGLPKIADLVAKTKEFHMDSVAITDHGVLYGVIEFYKTCLENEIKPLIGIEAYVMKAQDPHIEKDPKKKTNANHLILIAKNKTGYQNLMELTSIAHLEGYYYRPRFDKQTLTKYSEGIICLSGCGKGEVAETIVNSGPEKTQKVLQWYLDLFKDDYYLEIQRHQYDQYIDQAQDYQIKANLTENSRQEKLIGRGILQLSRALGLPLVATNDVHYLNQEDAVAQDALVAISTGTSVKSIDRLRYVDCPTYHYRSPQEMLSTFSDLPEAVSNAHKIAQKCDLQITIGQWFFPKIPDLPENKSEEQILRAKVKELLNDRINPVTQIVKDRLEYELDIICTKGYAGYFLICADLAAWATQQGIVINTRGSAAGSLVSYVLGITTVNPLIYYLPFERFLNPFRPSPPDIDIDIADNRRLDMIAYIVSRYGQDKVAQICTFGRMMARASVRDIARVMDYSYDTGDKIAKLIPIGSQGFPMYINLALATSPELKNLYDHDPDARKIMDLAQKIEGNARHCSVHAAAVVVSPQKITNYTPLQKESKGSNIITQYEWHACEDVGLIKFDILGITHLTILDAAIKKVEITTGKRINLQKIPLDDKKTFDLLGRGETVGVFQMIGSGMTKWLMELKPSRVEDLMAMVALYRPGPMQIISEYIARKQGKSPITYYHPKMKKYLEPSYGLLVYQDDLLFTSIELAGYDWKEVDKFRKAVGKKIPKEMAKQHKIFVDGCIKHSNMIKAEAEDIWKLFEPFQGYGFNKAHAASYGIISYYTAYMKANYPVEYMTAMLTADANDIAKVAIGVEAARKMGIQVLSPDINLSGIDFTIESHLDSLNSQVIRFGLDAIKNVGKAAIQAILEARKPLLPSPTIDISKEPIGESDQRLSQINAQQEQPFTSLTDFFIRVDNRKVNKKVLESLIKAGAFDHFGNRAAQLSAVDDLRQKAEQQKKKRASGQVDLFSQINPPLEKDMQVEINQHNTKKNKKSVEDNGVQEINLQGIDGNKYGTSVDNFQDKLPDIPDFTSDQKLTMEKELLGFYLTDNPFATKLSGLKIAASHSIGELNALDHLQQNVKLAGIITNQRTVNTRKTNQPMAFCTLSDETGSIDCVIFPSIYSQTKTYWQIDQPVLVHGRVDYREEQLNLVVDSVISSIQEKIPASKLYDAQKDNQQLMTGNLIIIPKGTDKNKLIALNTLLKNNPGDDQLILIFENGKSGGRRVPIPFGIDYSKKLQKQVIELLKK